MSWIGTLTASSSKSLSVRSPIFLVRSRFGSLGLRGIKATLLVGESSKSEPRNEPSTERRPYKRWTMEDAKRWADKYERRLSILKIAKEEGADPGTVSAWLRKFGIVAKQGEHFVEQPPLKYSPELVNLISAGPDDVRRSLEQRVWGIQFSPSGLEQLGKFCSFVRLHSQRKGVDEISTAIDVHRSSILEWRNGTDQPYLVKTASAVVGKAIPSGWMFIPYSLASGGNEATNWVEVPSQIDTYGDLIRTIGQLKFHPDALVRA